MDCTTTTRFRRHTPGHVAACPHLHIRDHHLEPMHFQQHHPHRPWTTTIPPTTVNQYYTTTQLATCPAPHTLSHSQEYHQIVPSPQGHASHTLPGEWPQKLPGSPATSSPGNVIHVLYHPARWQHSSFPWAIYPLFAAFAACTVLLHRVLQSRGPNPLPRLILPYLPPSAPSLPLVEQTHQALLRLGGGGRRAATLLQLKRIILVRF